MTLIPDTSATGAYRSLAPIVLASGSPRRRELLTALGLEFEVCPSNAPEPPPAPGERPEDYARRMARVKTMEVAVLYPESVVLGADTIVVRADVNGPEAVLGKPAGSNKEEADADALAMLTALAGRDHVVVTGCCLALPGKSIPVVQAVSTRVRMRQSSEGELSAYVATGEPHDKAGAYAIQGLGAFLVESVQGSYTNVVGLPVSEVVELLLAAGVIAAR